MHSTRNTRRDFLRTASVAVLGTATFPAARAATDSADRSPVAARSRKARIATVCQAGNFTPTISGNRDYVMALVDQAAQGKPDLVCLPETFTTPGPLSKLPLDERAETVPGPTTDAAARRAKEYGCYVVCPLDTKQNGKYYNSAVILDRQGRIAGVYNKACPVTTSADYTKLEGGITPGNPDIPVFDLDFGRIGVQICFDIGFPENWDLLGKKGAQLVFWSSAYDGGFALQAHAYRQHYHVVSSVLSGRSRLVDPCGEILSETGKDKPVIVRDINLDFVVAHLDFNNSISDKIKARYGDRVDVRRSNPGCGHILMEPIDPAITCQQLQEEFGFESTFQYHDRHRAAYRQIRDGRLPAKQPARHGNRPQYGKF